MDEIGIDVAYPFLSGVPVNTGGIIIQQFPVVGSGFAKIAHGACFFVETAESKECPVPVSVVRIALCNLQQDRFAVYQIIATETEPCSLFESRRRRDGIIFPSDGAIQC